MVNLINEKNGVDGLDVTNGALHTYSPKEEGVKEDDPNKIIPQITDPSPIVVLWGPKTAGKSVTLIRLAKYLSKHNYTVSPSRNFRISDPEYVVACNNFENFVYSPIAPDGNGKIDFLLAAVSNGKKTVCQILEAPGEHYFDDKRFDASFPLYLNKIINDQVQKIYVFYLEIEWDGGNERIREKYDEKIANFFGRIRNIDSVILLCNKCDKQQQLIYNGAPMKSAFEQRVRLLYPRTFAMVRNPGLTGILQVGKKRYSFVPFYSANFNDIRTGGQMFIEGPDSYPENLWEAINQGIRGNIF